MVGRIKLVELAVKAVKDAVKDVVKLANPVLVVMFIFVVIGVAVVDMAVSVVVVAEGRVTLVWWL